MQKARIVVVSQVAHIDRDKVADLIRDALYEHYNDEFVFDPVVVAPRVDMDGEGYLSAYIVFDGDFERLNPRFRNGLLTMLEPQLMELGVNHVMGLAFVEKSEWEEVHKGHDYRESVLLS